MSSRTLTFGVPPPFEYEAPSSWLTRLACAQGLGSMDELLQFLELPAGVDLDWHLRGVALAELRRRCNLPPQSFAIAGRVMAGVLASGMAPERLLLRGKGNVARFRFCPCCLAERREPHLDVHWRFKCWRLCHVHNSLLVDACPACSCAVEHPCLMEATQAGRAGHASLSRCTRCSNRFSGEQAQQLGLDCAQLLNKHERQWLANGRAVLAALCEQRFKLRDQWWPIQSLGGHYRNVVGAWSPRLDQKLEAWRASRDFLAELSEDPDAQVAAPTARGALAG